MDTGAARAQSSSTSSSYILWRNACSSSSRATDLVRERECARGGTFRYCILNVPIADPLDRTFEGATEIEGTGVGTRDSLAARSVGHSVPQNFFGCEGGGCSICSPGASGTADGADRRALRTAGTRAGDGTNSVGRADPADPDLCIDSPTNCALFVGCL